MKKVSNELNEEELKAKVIEEKNTEEIKEVEKKEEAVKSEKASTKLKEKELNKENHKEEEKNQESPKTEDTKFKQSTGEFQKKSKKTVYITGVLVVILAVLSIVFALMNMGNNKIIAGVKIDGINMKGMTREEAKVTLNKKIEEKLNKDIKIKIDDNEEQVLQLSQIDLQYDVDNIVELAYKIGRKGNIFVNNFDILQSKLFGNDLSLNALYNEEMLEGIIKDIKSKIPNAVKEADFSIEDENLIVTKGLSGFTINEEEFKQKLKTAMNLSGENVITLNSFKAEPQDINIEEIYEEVHTVAKDAYYTQNPFQIYPEVLGVDFDIEEAKEILKEDKQEYIIPLKITKPNKTVNDIGTEAFPDMLSTFTTRYDASNAPRTTNLKLAVGKINGAVVMPGETFSYNKTVGKRTAEAGYKEAAGYQGGKVVQMTGGGICQVSSTLYDAVVMANLDVVERHNHAFTTSYVGAGKDATVVYGALDFKFKNTRKYPVTIKATAQNGILKIDIYGIKEEKEYEIEISTTILGYISYSTVYEDDPTLNEGYEKVTQRGSRGCRSITYKIFKLNGVEVSRTVLSNDKYDAMNTYITRGTKSTAIAPVEQPTEPSQPSTPDVPEPPTEPDPPDVPPEEPEVPDPGEETPGEEL